MSAAKSSGWQAHGCEVLDADGAWIADCCAEHAPLIAASEDLLAALEDMTARLRVCARVGGSDKEYIDIACSQADAAIARVRSQS